MPYPGVDGAGHGILLQHPKWVQGTIFLALQAEGQGPTGAPTRLPPPPPIVLPPPPPPLLIPVPAPGSVGGAPAVHTPAPEVPVVPEAETGAMVLAGLVALAAVRWRRGRRR